MVASHTDSQAPVLDVLGLSTKFKTKAGYVHAVNNIDIKLHKGEILGVVGESGSGKSVSMMSILKLLPIPPAEISADKLNISGQDVRDLDHDGLRQIRGGKVGFIFQDPMTSLNPVYKVGAQLAEPLQIHKNMSKKQALIRAGELMELVGIPDAKTRLNDYPHQFSGGMRQRVMIAMALTCEPDILIADEPTTALDVTIQAQIIELVKEIQHRLGMAIIWITHDLGVVAEIADRVMVMYGGQVVEEAPVNELFSNARHPYTRALLESVPSITHPKDELAAISGQPPILMAKPDKCSFYDRCSYAGDVCLRSNPKMQEITANHKAACYYDFDKGGFSDG